MLTLYTPSYHEPEDEYVYVPYRRGTMPPYIWVSQGHKSNAD